MMWLAQGYEPSYRTINRFSVHKDMKELLHQYFFQFRCQPVETKEIDNEAIFIDDMKIVANYFMLPEHIEADAGYSSEQNYDDILTNCKREALITYQLYLREQK